MTSIVGLLRFSVLSTTYNPFVLSEGKSFEEYAAMILGKRRLERRFALLENICLPSFDSQADKDFKILIVAPARLSEEHQARLNAIVESRPYLMVHYANENKFRMKHVSKIVLAEIPPEAGSFITFRIDDDDAVSDTFIEDLRKYDRASLNGFFLTLCRGYKLGVSEHGRSIGIEAQIRPNVSVGFSYISERANPKTIFDITDRHKFTHQRHPVITDAIRNAYVLTHHGGNGSGDARVLSTHEHSPQEAQQLLREAGFHIDLPRLAEMLIAAEAA